MLALCVRVCLIQFLLQLQSHGTRDIISPGVCLTIPFPSPFPFPFPFASTVAFPFPFPFPFPSSVAFPYPLPSFVACPFLVHVLPPCMSSSPSPSSVSLPSRGRRFPPVGTQGSAQCSSSSSSSIISFQFGGLQAMKSPSLYCRQLCGSIFALILLLLYQD